MKPYHITKETEQYPFTWYPLSLYLCLLFIRRIILLLWNVFFILSPFLQERIKQRSLKVHEKTTYATRINFKTAQMIRPADSDEEQEKSDEDDGRAVAVKDDPQFTLAVTRGTLLSLMYLCQMQERIKILYL